ncbi:MAG TPA: DUF1592 domain-containing protein [Polyangiaceae bacterium]|nr:DUF1592 domain-containing protein [Polyangiaceae bacterium]
MFLCGRSGRTSVWWILLAAALVPLGCTGTLEPGGTSSAGAGAATGGGNGPGSAGNTPQGMGSFVGSAGTPGFPAGGAAAGNGGGAAGTAVSTAGTGAGGGAQASCVGAPVPDAKRVVRLSFNQLSVTLHRLLGDTFGKQIDADFEIGDRAAIARTFPPLSSPREGSVITTGLWQKVDQIASAAGSYVSKHLAEVTPCGAAPSEVCARDFVKTFAESSYRRPLTPAESASILQVFDEVKAIYGTIPEAIQHSVYALLQAPQFLYRSELGDSKDKAGPLTPFELATNLSYFLTDGPPDAALLDAAKQGKFTTPEQVSAQVDRLLALPTTRRNLEGAMFSYFALDNLATVKIDDAAFTTGTEAKPYTGVRESAYREAQLFFESTLWAGPVTGLLTNKRSKINSTLARLYGVTLPSTSDESQFVAVDLPASRAGLITQVAFLASNSRPDVPSVVARGLVVNKALLCANNPPFPEDAGTQAAIADANRSLQSASERERAQFRDKTAPCFGCHRSFDAYGLALDSYDAIGRYRTKDPEGRPIDPSVQLPPSLGATTAKDAVDMQAQIAASPGFASCISKNMLNWALAEGSQLLPESCATQSVVTGFNASDRSYSALLKEIARSAAFMQRAAGEASTGGNP